MRLKLATVQANCERKVITLTPVYDTLYKQGQKVLDAHNPCNFHKNPNGSVSCTRGRPCCSGCQYLGPDGCTVKSLGCKLTLCSTAREKYPEASAALTSLAQTAEALGIPLHYAEGMGYYCW